MSHTCMPMLSTDRTSPLDSSSSRASRTTDCATPNLRASSSWTSFCFGASSPVRIMRSMAARNSFGLALSPVRSQPWVAAERRGSSPAMRRASAIDIETPVVAFHGGPILKLESATPPRRTRASGSRFSCDVGTTPPTPATKTPRRPRPARSSRSVARPRSCWPNGERVAW